MLKRIGIPMLALMALLMIVNPTPASAKTHWSFGVYAGPPVYAYPYAYSPYAYSYPYAYSPYYYDYYAYPAYPRTYSYYYSSPRYYRNWNREEWRERREHREHEWREHHR